MKVLFVRLRTLLPLAIACHCSIGTAHAADLTGLWQARHLNNTQAMYGPLLISRVGTAWRAQIAGAVTEATNNRGRIHFAFGASGGSFTGVMDSHQRAITGHWLQVPTADSGNLYASPVTLQHISKTSWRGIVKPLYDPFTFFLKMSARGPNTLDAFMNNPQRDLGNLWRVAALQVNGPSVTLVSQNGDAIAQGTYRSTQDELSLYFDGRGGTYDFSRVAAASESDFYPRGRPRVQYAYAPPPQLNDGWNVGTVDQVGLSRKAIERFLQFLIDMPMDGPTSRQVHALLIARHGKLVVEEYFHGMSGDRPHDPRSASKSITSVLFGAAIQAGLPVSASTKVYQAMNGGTFPRGLDPLKRALTVQSLLTMSSGWDCDDNDDNSPGSETNMSDRLNVSNWYQYTLNLKMIRPPGTGAVYCSIQPNMVGGVLARATHQTIPDLFHTLLAVPMQIQEYYIPIQSSGDAFMGGGLRLLARDYMKFPQLMMNGGVWNGRRIVSKEWATRATSALVMLNGSPDAKYGYLWWIRDFSYRGHSVRAFSMLGAGGQTFTAIPALDLVVGFESGDYMHRRMPHVFNTYVPEYILPAIVGP
jgi:CubicO group peptidase (beta-lactamase class C family)